jgi:hypothetical protein
VKIEAYALQAAEHTIPGSSRVKGTVALPEGARIVYVGATPPKGEMFIFAEVSPMKLPMRTMDVVVLQTGDVIPNGYEYLSYILAVPILFIYKAKDHTIIT